jgi:gamma-glutamyl-gamma-aminobutyrate hydrolase PuuD
MSRPLMLVTPSTEASGAELKDHSISLGSRYLRAVLDCGGLPVALPLTTDRDQIAGFIARCDAVLLTGGDDIQPRLYWPDVPPKLLATCECVEAARDVMELTLLDELFKAPRPLLAICRGHQLVNVALGGRLYVDLPSQRPGDLRHSQTDRKYDLVHQVSIASDTRMAGIFGQPSIGVNSTHHQAISQLAEPLRIAIQAPDGVIEGTELHPEHSGLLPWFASVQFHPERLYDRHPEHGRLFHAFVEAARS